MYSISFLWALRDKNNQYFQTFLEGLFFVQSWNFVVLFSGPTSKLRFEKNPKKILENFFCGSTDVFMPSRAIQKKISLGLLFFYGSLFLKTKKIRLGFLYR
jgi:hypothetical protein